MGRVVRDIRLFRIEGVVAGASVPRLRGRGLSKMGGSHADHPKDLDLFQRYFLDP